MLFISKTTCVVHVWVHFLHCISCIFWDVIEHEIFTNFICHGVEQPWHYLTILKFSFLNICVPFLGTLWISRDVVFLSFSSKKDLDWPYALCIVLTIQFMANDEVSKPIVWAGGKWSNLKPFIRFLVSYGLVETLGLGWFRSSSDSMRK